jgi:hypothetical protein
MVDFKEIEHEGGSADFQEESGWEHAGVSVEQMEAAVFASIGEWFVAGVDDGAIELHPLEEVVVDVIGALADLEMAVRAVA